MFQKLSHIYKQIVREHTHPHHAVEMSELLQLEPYCKLDNRTLRVLDVHSNKDVYKFFRDVLLLNEFIDVSTICKVDIKFIRNTNVHQLNIHYWTLHSSTTFVHSTSIITTDVDATTMLQLGYGA